MTPMFFIYQDGFKQISLPPFEPNKLNVELINVTSCDDGVYITTDINLEEAVTQLNQFIGHPVTEIYCDSNSIEDGSHFRGAMISKGNHQEKVIYLDFYKESEIQYEKGLYLHNHRKKETYQIEAIKENGFTLLDVHGALFEVSDLSAFRSARKIEREQFQLVTNKA
ncbi:hypothetical protein JOD82_002269 [Paenibacillus sp. 1182]|uniref:hypothetical protein n=1 Tax=Paenibacillus sp. 1182 TaxID=2806565 RepID=UPI001B6A4DFB|nr:hypothetical protein [Paenibacillus sp. 1182]MBP1309249.1 hypothetical protein [Paenibacillus sp. 1182]